MKKTPIVMGLLMLVSAIFAQSVEQSKLKVKFGPKFEMKKTHPHQKFIGNPVDGIVNLGGDVNSLSIHGLGTDGTLKSSEYIETKTLGTDAYALSAYKIGDKYFWFYNTTEKKGPSVLHAVEIDTKTGKRGATKDIVSKNDVTGQLLGVYGWYDRYVIRTSEDSSKVLVAYRKVQKSSDDKVNYDEVGFIVYDSKFNQLWAKEVKMPYTEVIMDNEDVMVDNAGNAYLLAKVYPSDRREEKTKDDKPAYRYELMRISETSTSIKKTVIKAEDKFISSIDMVEQAEGGFLFFGAYSNYPNKNTAHGVYVVKLDKDGNLKGGKTNYDYPQTVLDLNSSISHAKDVYFIKFRKAILHNDGSMLLVAEGYDTRSNGNSTVTYYGDIYLTKLGADGEMEWCKGIRKYQLGSAYTENFGVGAAVAENGSYYIFYTDVEGNFTKSPTDKRENVSGWGGWIVYNKIKPDGTMTKEKVWEYRDKLTRVDPTEMRQYGNTVMIHGFIDDTQRLVLLELE